MNDNIFRSTIHSIFEKSDGILKEAEQQHRGSTKKKSTDQLELALAVLLVDLASCDQNFDPEEYQVISNGLMRMFGTSKTEISALVNQAQGVLKNMRGVGRFAEELKENLSEEEKKVALEVIDEVIGADGQTDGFETYLRAKFCDLLGIADVQN